MGLKLTSNCCLSKGHITLHSLFSYPSHFVIVVRRKSLACIKTTANTLCSCVCITIMSPIILLFHCWNVSRLPSLNGTLRCCFRGWRARRCRDGHKRWWALVRPDGRRRGPAAAAGGSTNVRGRPGNRRPHHRPPEEGEVQLFSLGNYICLLYSVLYIWQLTWIFYPYIDTRHFSNI